MVPRIVGLRRCCCRSSELLTLVPQWESVVANLKKAT